MNRLDLPFPLPERDPVIKIRQRDLSELRQPGERTQAMRGFDPQYRDIVDYIVKITEEIWTDRSIGRIYDTYDASCTVYTSLGVVRSVEEVIASTVQTLYAQPNGETHHLNVAWSGDEQDFYTAHLGFSRSQNLGATIYGPATGKKYGIHFAADCVSRDNRIHTEWLARDGLALVLQLGFDPHAIAPVIAELPARERHVVAPETRLDGSAPRAKHVGPIDTWDGFWDHHFTDIWNRRELDHVGFHYAPEAVVHWAGGRVARGHRAVQALLLGLFASIPDATVRVEHKCWSEETDGVIVAVRWQLEGTTASLGAFGPLPAGRPVSLIGMSHFRFAGRYIVEEWTVFDEFAALVQAYRA
jgi:predicted ester cyclase